MFTSYITYKEYTDLGGKVAENVFANYERKAQRLLDAITFDRVKSMTLIPDEVKEVLTEFIDRTSAFDDQTQSGDTIKTYSNGVEKLEYTIKTEKQLDKELRGIAYKWLPHYLTARSVNFDVEQYLQSENNNS